jgi:hypothetical protein
MTFELNIIAIFFWRICQFTADSVSVVRMAGRLSTAKIEAVVTEIIRIVSA